jgi:hypothetical protein
MEQTECFETSAYKIQSPGNYPEENIQLYAFLVFPVYDSSHVLSPTSLNRWTPNRWVQIMKFLIMKYSPPFCDFVFIASKKFPILGVYLFLDMLNPNDVFRWEWDAKCRLTYVLH